MERSRLRNKLFNGRSDLDWNILFDCRNANIEISSLEIAGKGLS